MGLYGERVGALHLRCATAQAAVGAKGQLYRLQRGQISRPPRIGARLVAAIVSDEELLQNWAQDLRVMSGRIKEMRQALYDQLSALKTPGEWEHLVSQVCLFNHKRLKHHLNLLTATDWYVFVHWVDSRASGTHAKELSRLRRQVRSHLRFWV